MKKGVTIVIFIIIIIAAILIYIYAISPSGKGEVCEKPYIYATPQSLGKMNTTLCCIDEDDNSKCDEFDIQYDCLKASRLNIDSESPPTYDTSNKEVIFSMKALGDIDIKGIYIVLENDNENETINIVSGAIKARMSSGESIKFPGANESLEYIVPTNIIPTSIGTAVMVEFNDKIVPCQMTSYYRI